MKGETIPRLKEWGWGIMVIEKARLDSDVNNCEMDAEEFVK